MVKMGTFTAKFKDEIMINNQQVARKPNLLAVMGEFSKHAQMHNWDDLERFFNPNNIFDEVHIVDLHDNYDYETYVFGSLKIYPIRSYFTKPGLKIIDNIFTMALAIISLRQIIKNHSIDLIAQIFGGPLKYGLPALYVAQEKKLPLLITLLNDYPSLEKMTYPLPFRWISRILWSLLFNNSTRIRSICDHIAEFAYSYGISKDRVNIIPCKEDLKKFQNRPTQEELDQTLIDLNLEEFIENKIVFFTVARLIKAKNVANMLHAFALASKNDPSAIYLIAGDGPLRSHLANLVQHLGITEKVRFLGYTPHNQLRCLYHISNVFLFATLYEGQPRVVIQALLSNLPIICSNYGQVCEVVKDGMDGLWVDPYNIESISNAIKQLASGADVRNLLSKHEGFESQNYSIEHVSRQESAMYLDIIQTYNHQQRKK